MLSDAQCEVIKNRVNAEADIPFLREETEGKIIDKVIEVINPKLEPALRAMLPNPYVDCLKLALMEGLSKKEKDQRISVILRRELETQLALQLSGSMDVALVPEEVEQDMMRIVAQKTIEEFVEWTVGEIDKILPTRLQETRVAAGVTSVGGAGASGTADGDRKDNCSMS